MRSIRMMFLQTFEYFIFPEEANYPATVDAQWVAEDEMAALSENPQALDDVVKENAQVFVMPADKRVYWAYPTDVNTPRKWHKRYREGMVQLTIPAVIVSEVNDDDEEQSGEETGYE